MTASYNGGGASSPSILIQAISVLVLLVLMCSYLYAVKMGYVQELLFFHKSLHHSVIALGLIIVLLSLHDFKFFRILLFFGLLAICIHSARNAYFLFQNDMHYQSVAHVSFILIASITGYGVVFNKLISTHNNLNRTIIFFSAVVISTSSTAFIVLLTTKLYLVAALYLGLIFSTVALILFEYHGSTALNIIRVALKVVLILPYAYWSYRMLIDDVYLSFARLYFFIAMIGVVSALLDGVAFKRRR